jgi:hypothetical protein
MLHCCMACAGVWGTDPVLGAMTDYATNPLLLPVSNAAETNVALLIDAPTTYVADNLKFYVMPSFRVGDTSGYSSVTSDYEHLNLKGEFDTERSVFTAAVGAAQDSSLYQDYLLNGATGVRRDTVTADLNWDRNFTERLDVDTDVDSMRIRYGPAVGVGTLIDYDYTSISPTLSWQSSERGKLTLAASVGRYNTLDGSTESRNGNLQVGYVGQISELWSLSATGGYSRALNRISVDEEFLIVTPFGPVLEIVPVTAESSQNGAIYSVKLTRQGTLLTVNASASRLVTPTGFAFLARQNVVDLGATYNMTARWSLGADARYVKSQNPQVQGEFFAQTVRSYSLNATWQWTETCTLTLAASRVAEQVPTYHFDGASNEATVTVSRKFGHIDLN